MKRQVGLKLEEELIAWIDADRGSVPRAVWMVEAFKARLAGPGPVGVAEAAVVHGQVPKPVRLERASGVLSSAQAKVGVKPIDWRAKETGQ